MIAAHSAQPPCPHPARALALALLGALGAAAWTTAPLRAQDYPPLVVEARAGAAIPTQSFRTGIDRGGDIERAPTFGLHFVYRGPTGGGPYIGFSQHRFDCAADGCPGAEYVMTTWDLGAQKTFARNGTVWVRGGLLFGRMERDFAPPPSATSSAPTRVASLLSLGAEAGLGLRIPIRGRLALTPGARYGWLNTQFRDGPIVGLRWVAADLGVGLGF